MRRIIAGLLLIGMLGITASAADLFSFRSARVELDVGFEAENSETQELEEFLKLLRNTSITAEGTLQQLDGGKVLRADIVLQSKVLPQEVQTVECWYELDRSAALPRITVIEKNKQKDVYYELDIHKLPGGMDTIKALNRALESAWNGRIEKEENDCLKFEFPAEAVAETLAQWTNLNYPGRGGKAAASFGGATAAVELADTGGAYQLGLQLNVTEQQAAYLLGVQKSLDGERRVLIRANCKLSDINESPVAEKPQILAEQSIDANWLIDKKMFDSRNVTVLYNGSVLQFDAQPRLEGGTTMVPIRGIMEAAGVPPEQIRFDGTSGKVTIMDSGKTIELYLGSTVAFVDGREVQLLCAAYETKGRTFVPLRFVSEELGFQVEWTGLDQPDGTCTGGVVRLER